MGDTFDDRGYILYFCLKNSVQMPRLMELAAIKKIQLSNVSYGVPESLMEMEEMHININGKITNVYSDKTEIHDIFHG